MSAEVVTIPRIRTEEGDVYVEAKAVTKFINDIVTNLRLAALSMPQEATQWEVTVGQAEALDTVNEELSRAFSG